MDKQKLNERIAEFMAGWNTHLDYTAPENWGKVIDKLRTSGDVNRIVFDYYKGKCKCELWFSSEFAGQIGSFAKNGWGENEGEAICQATYQYLKAQEGNK